MVGERVGPTAKDDGDGINVIKMKDKDICEMFSEKQDLKDTCVGAALPPMISIKLHDRLESKTIDDLASSEIKIHGCISHNENLSDPFDDMAVLPEVETDDDPNTPIVTVRSVLVGVFMACFGATIAQVSRKCMKFCLYQPSAMS